MAAGHGFSQAVIGLSRGAYRAGKPKEKEMVSGGTQRYEAFGIPGLESDELGQDEALGLPIEGLLRLLGILAWLSTR
jgi:hypothetical protein